MTPARLARLTSGKATALSKETAKRITAQLPGATRLCERLSGRREAELREHRAVIVRDGLRETARRLGVDASNLRRGINRVVKT